MKKLPPVVFRLQRLYTKRRQLIVSIVFILSPNQKRRQIFEQILCEASKIPQEGFRLPRTACAAWRKRCRKDAADFGSVSVSVACIYPQSPQAKGNISFGYVFSLIGISPPRGSPAGALLSCDGLFSLDLGRDASIIMFSAC